MARRHPMTAEQARQIVDEMRNHTPPDAQRRVIDLALVHLGNLSEGAQEVYAARLEEL